MLYLFMKHLIMNECFIEIIGKESDAFDLCINGIIQEKWQKI